MTEAIQKEVGESTPSSAPSVNGRDREITDEKDQSINVVGRLTANPAAYSQEVTTQAKEQTALEGEATHDEDDTEYPGPFKLFIITLALCLAVFCMALDNTIIATAIPKITNDFRALDDVGFYGSAYLLTTCSFQLFFGKLYSFFSLKLIYLCAIGIFELGSLICGATPTSDGLIVGRAIAGLGAAGIFSGSILILAHSVPLRKRPIYTGLIGAMYGIASVAGPLLGGVFTDKVTWRLCFYINLPLGLLTVVFIFFFYHPPPRKEQGAANLDWKQKLASMDLEGTFFFIPAIVALLLALQWGGATYNWGNWRIIFLFCIAGVLVIIFLGIQVYKGERATVPLRIISQRNVAAAAFFAFNLGATFFILIYYLPIWFQAIKGTTAVKSGIDNIPMVLSVTIFSILSGIGTTVTGYYTPWVWMSTVLMSVGAGLLTTFTTTTGHSEWIGYQVIFGAGVGLGIQSPLIGIQTVLPLKDVPIGTAVLMFCQLLGGALFISVGQNVFENQLIKNVHTYAPTYPAENIFRTGATALRAGFKDPKYAPLLDKVIEAYNKALTQTWYVAVAMAALSVFGSVFLQMRSIKGKRIEHGAAA